MISEERLLGLAKELRRDSKRHEGHVQKGTSVLSPSSYVAIGMAIALDIAHDRILLLLTETDEKGEK